MTKRIICASLRALALILFASMISFAICGLQASNDAKLEDELLRYKEAYKAVPVTVTVTPRTDEEGRTSLIAPWTADLFTGNNPVEIDAISPENGERVTKQVSFAEYLKDVRIKMSKKPQLINGSDVTTQIPGKYPYLIGITSIPSDEQLLSENGCEITWYDGYDETVFGSEELVCLVPAGKAEAYDNGNGETVLYFYYAWGRMENGTYVEVSRQEYECTLKIVGTYTAGDEMSIYCPFSIIEQVYVGLDESLSPDSISATIADNMRLDEFRETASVFFPKLAENPGEVPKIVKVNHRSNSYTFSSELNSISIDDDDLFDYTAPVLEKETELNSMLEQTVLVASAAAGLLVGLIVTLLRKRGIGLKWEKGDSGAAIVLGALLEQMIFTIVGIAAGGACYSWKPIDKLFTFAVIYFAVLTFVTVTVMSIILIKLSKSMKRDRSYGGDNFVTVCKKIIFGTLKRMKRTPVRAVALMIFASIVTLLLCGLQASSDAEMRRFEKACEEVAITVSVSNPSGKDTETVVVSEDKVVEIPDPLFVTDWVYELFTGKVPVSFYDVSGIDDPTKNRDELNKLMSESMPVRLSLTEYLKDIKVKGSISIERINGGEFNEPNLIGMTSLSCEPELLPENGCDLLWREGYDESIFDSEDAVCLIPSGKAEQYDNGNGEVVLTFTNKVLKSVSVDGEFVVEYETVEYEYTFKIAGTYTGGDWNSVYCSIENANRITEEARLHLMIGALSGNIADYSRLDEFREKASFCFLEPGPGSVEVPWDYYVDHSYYEFYPYALKIESAEMDALALALEEKIESNRRASLAVLGLFAVAGAVLSVAMIRSRKREILLMRTLGEPLPRVFFGLILEQIICILLGMIISGAAFLWKPIDKLLIYALIYFVCLVLASLVIMSKKLIRTVKEVK